MRSLALACQLGCIAVEAGEGGMLWNGAYMGVLSCGLKKRTPCSVTCASCNRETIWKLFVRLLVLVGCCKDVGNGPSTVCVSAMSAKVSSDYQFKCLSNYLSRYYAAMTATYAHHRSHPVSSVPASIP